MKSKGAHYKLSRESLLNMANTEAKVQAATEVDLHQPSPGLVLFFRPSKHPLVVIKDVSNWFKGSFAQCK